MYAEHIVGAGFPWYARMHMHVHRHVVSLAKFITTQYFITHLIVYLAVQIWLHNGWEVLTPFIFCVLDTS